MDEEGLLLAIREQPADYCVRSIYADWLDEHDQMVRANFIRQQLKGGELIIPHGQSPPPFLATELEHFRNLGVETVTFRCGFIEGICLLPNAFLAQAGQLFQAAPLRVVTLSGRQPQQPVVYPGRWSWDVRPDLEQASNRLPLVLGPYMTGEQEPTDPAPQLGPGCGFWRYRSEGTARWAASTACVGFGREAAHLSPLG